MDLEHGLAHLEAFDTAKTSVLVCEFGLKSAFLAERMRESGFAAHNFRGGLKAMLQYAAQADLVPLELHPDFMNR